MLIYAITEYYPSLYKPYFDTQFAQLLEDGHDLRIFTLGGGDRSTLEPKVVKWRLDRRTSHLPTGRRSLPAFASRIFAQFAAAPRARLAALQSAIHASPPSVRRITDAARLLTLPLEPPDLCLVHNLLAARDVRFLRTLYPGVPIAFYYHGGEIPGMTISEDGVAESFSAADVVFTNTERSKAHAVSRGCDRDSVVVCPVGFDLSEFPVAADRQYRADGRLNVLSIGRLSPEKGFAYAIEAARQLAESGERNFHYSLIGGGALEQSLREQVAAAELGSLVELTGPVSRERLTHELAAADVVVLPSIVVGTWEENQACVVQEAMLMHAVVVATATGGVPESLAPEMHRFLVPEGDASAIACRLRQLAALGTDELAALGRAGRAFAESRYDIRQLNRKLLAETIARRPRDRALKPA